MKEQIEARLNILKSEFDSGQKVMADLEARQVDLNNTLMRISGAIQVLEEELNKSNGNAASDAQQHDTKPPEILELKKESTVR